MGKRLTKSSTNRKVCGVCGGFAEYLNCDVTLLRLIYVIGSLLLGAGILGLILYFVAACIMPDDSI